MLNGGTFIETLAALFSYMFVYNIALILIFWNLYSFVGSDFKSIYSFNEFKFNFFLTSTTVVSLLSMAGVPPFAGFFSKILILTILTASNFFLFYVFFFTLLFLGLYFYTQNLRFLLSSSKKTLTYSFDFCLRYSTLYLVSSLSLFFCLIFGVIFFDDLFVYFSWILA